MIIPVQDLCDPAFSIFHTLNEAQLRHYYEPEGGIFIAESAKVTERALDAGCVPHSMLVNNALHTEEAERVLRRIGADFDIPVYTAPENVMTKITGYHLTGGLLCAMYRPEMPSPSELLSRIQKTASSGTDPDGNGIPKKQDQENGCPDGRLQRIAVLENVTNPTNAGAIIRSAAALGMDAVLFREGCADPLNRRAIRVSMGCVFQIPWTYISEYSFLKEAGFHCVATALTDHAVSLLDPSLKQHEKLAVFMGAEGNGLFPETIDFCDDTVCIPMQHGVDSLNVAAASAVMFWELGKHQENSVLW